MPVGYHHLTHAERCQIHALLHRGVVETGDGPRSGKGSRDDLAPPWAAKLTSPAGRPPGHGPPSGSVGGAPEEDVRALGGRGRTVAGRLEPGTDRRPVPAAGRGDGGERVDLPARAGRPAGRRDPALVPATSREEAERARGASCGSWSHCRSGGPCLLAANSVTAKGQEFLNIYQFWAKSTAETPPENCIERHTDLTR